MNSPFSNTVVPCHKSTVKHQSSRGIIREHGHVIQWAVWSTSLHLVHVYRHYSKGSRIKPICQFSLYISCTLWSGIIPLCLPENLLPLIKKSNHCFGQKREVIQMMKSGKSSSSDAVHFGIGNCSKHQEEMSRTVQIWDHLWFPCSSEWKSLKRLSADNIDQAKN